MKRSWNDTELDDELPTPKRSKVAKLARPAATFVIAMVATFAVTAVAVNASAGDRLEGDAAGETATAATAAPSTAPAPAPVCLDEDDAGHSGMQYRGVEVMLARFEGELLFDEPRKSKKQRKRRR